MTTEVHIKKCRSHLSYLGRIMSCIASRLGMDNAEIKEAEYAVEQAFLSSIGAESDTQEDLIISFSSSDSCVTVDITDPVLFAELGEMTEIHDHSSLPNTVYDIDTIKSSTGKTIRIISPGKLGMKSSVNRIAPLSGLEAVSAHR